MKYANIVYRTKQYLKFSNVNAQKIEKTTVLFNGIGVICGSTERLQSVSKEDILCHF